MSSMNRQLLVALGATLIFLVGCQEDTIFTPPDPDIQLNQDREAIKDYISEKGYTAVDTTSSGVHYIILDTGSGADINFNDIVSINYIGRLTDGSVFDTNIPAVAIEAETFDSARNYQPIRFTHTSNGWTLATSNFVRGFVDGVSTTVSIMNVGGHSEIIMPSSLAYGGTAVGRVPANSVLIFEIFPIQVR